MKQDKDCKALEVDEVQVRRNVGATRIGPGSDPGCCKCRRPLWSQGKYRIRIYKTAAMDAPGFHYHCMTCPCP